MRPYWMLGLVLCGCATTKDVALPDGDRGLAINCSGSAMAWSDCMDAAAKKCGGPYTVIDRSGGSGGAVAIPAGTSTIIATAVDREMIVKCGKAPQ